MQGQTQQKSTQQLFFAIIGQISGRALLCEAASSERDILNLV